MIIRESLNEAIKHLSPKSKEEFLSSLNNLSLEQKIIELKEYGLSDEDIKDVIEKENLSNIDKLKFIYLIKNTYRYSSLRNLYSKDELKDLFNKLSPKDKFIMRLMYTDDDIIDIVTDAVNAKIPDTEIINAIDKNNNYHRNNDYDKAQANILLIKLNKSKRTQKSIEEDEEYNIYVFIGFREKKPISLNGKTYYEDKLGTEGLIKIDKYKVKDLQSVNMMKMRARIQYPNEDAGVYMIKLPKDLFDEMRYDNIPEEYNKLFDEHKTKI